MSLRRIPQLTCQLCNMGCNSVSLGCTFKEGRKWLIGDAQNIHNIKCFAIQMHFPFLPLCSATAQPTECKMSAESSAGCWESEVELCSPRLISACTFKVCQLNSSFLHHWPCFLWSAALLSHQQCILSSTMWLIVRLLCWLTRDVALACSLWI